MGKKRKKALVISLVIVMLIIVLMIIGLKIILKVDVKNKIAVIPIIGVISSGNGDGSLISGDSVSSSTIVSFIEEANKDNSVKGIILNINSPGGGVVASKEIVDAVKKTNKPVVALIRDIGASGGYWVASAADYIIADPLSVTGSIGVIGSYLEFSDLFSKYGVKYQRITTGVYKDLGSPYSNLTDMQRELLLGKLSKIHKYFIDDVNKNRKKDLTRYANGLFYLGTEAKEYGLIDGLGGKEEAINVTMKLANISKYELVVYRKETSIFDILSKIFSNFGFSVGEGIGSSFDAKSDSGIRLE